MSCSRPLAACAALLSLGLATRAAATPVYFLVAEPSGSGFHGDSYVLPLENPSDIAHARALVAEGASAGATIVFARMAAGPDGINRDWRAPGEPEWSWHVVSFEGFGDFGIELYDGWPTYVESDVTGWIANTGGTVGFWSYTVVEELTQVPEPSALALVAAGLFPLAAAAYARRPAPEGRRPEPVGGGPG
jgi:hypothetical protein